MAAKPSTVDSLADMADRVATRPSSSFAERARKNLWKIRLYFAKEIDVWKKDAQWARRSAGAVPSPGGVCSSMYGNPVKPAKVRPFYGDAAAIWSMLIRSILHKQGTDFKSFLGVLRAYLQGLDNPVVVECSQVRQIERKEEMRSCSATTGD
jgi:hypothetical protein